METHHGRQVIMSLTHPLLVRWKSDDRDVNVLIRFKAKMDAQSDTRLRIHAWMMGTRDFSWTLQRCHYRIGFKQDNLFLYKRDEQQPSFCFTTEIKADPAVRRL
ncbi:hypothetical protein O0I10_006367 [Lichtheimia ornata]|uniref:Uncharacterized protein n=1 Tax=Lichtheimia ornata TaxID=688661 RepID=A0AAD7V2Z1_9FUNG|nr:uncharacterized protein O0I10_006367 [Lichtheimia ornata]KAJ8657839.1 hypothetical protein O0I10_006367 [Lichtheimia ornata]